MNNISCITMIGSGYVGLVSGVCFAELGFKVICVDKDLAKIQAIQAGKIPIYEPGLSELVQKNLALGRLLFSTHLESVVQQSELIFIAVGTPTHPKTGEADLSFVESVAFELAPLLNLHKTIIVKSTVPVGTGQRIKNILKKLNPKSKFSMVSNPEFLREGSAVFDFMNPDRIIVGTETVTARQMMDQLYQPLAVKGSPIVHSNIETAELIKYTANCFLATRIAFVNEIASLCEKLSADVENVMLGVGLDKRIGSGYLKAGPGFGGSCFPKDTQALRYVAEQSGAPLQILDSVILANEFRKKHMIQKIIEACNGTVKGKTLAILGLAFKANTDDVRDSAAITIITGLQEKGAKIKVFDPEAMEKAENLLSNVYFAKDVYDAISGAESVVIVTEWEIFAQLDFNRVKRIMKNSDEHSEPLLIDLRNLYSTSFVTKAGFRYSSVGRPIAYPLPQTEKRVEEVADELH